MKIVIDIPEEIYLDIKAGNTRLCSTRNVAIDTIANGKPLPKGHGVLKDVTNLMRGLYTDMQTIEETFTSRDVYNMIDKECPTIIEADEEEK